MNHLMGQIRRAVHRIDSRDSGISPWRTIRESVSRLGEDAGKCKFFADVREKCRIPIKMNGVMYYSSKLYKVLTAMGRINHHGRRTRNQRAYRDHEEPGMRGMSGNFKDQNCHQGNQDRVKRKCLWSVTPGSHLKKWWVAPPWAHDRILKWITWCGQNNGRTTDARCRPCSIWFTGGRL